MKSKYKGRAGSYQKVNYDGKVEQYQKVNIMVGLNRTEK